MAILDDLSFDMDFLTDDCFEEFDDELTVLNPDDDLLRGLDFEALEEALRKIVGPNPAPGKKFSCYHCSQIFDEKSILQHFASLQSGSSKAVEDHPGKGKECACKECRTKGGTIFICEKCNKEFTSKECLEKHSKVHEIYYKCEECNRNFSTKNSLLSHKRFHSREIYACDRCEKLFSCRNHLLAHRGKHHDIPSGTQGQEAKPSLRANKRVHMGTAFYTCDTCSKIFNWRVHFEKHKRLHQQPAQ